MNVTKTLEQLGLDMSKITILDTIPNGEFITFVLKGAIEFQVDLDIDDVLE